MATTAKEVRDSLGHKYKTKYHNRCALCGRPHGFIRLVGLCRLCFRRLAHSGQLPGFKKSSW